MIYLDDWRARIDKTLEAYLPDTVAMPTRLHEAMRYSLFAGGKRIRPILAIAAFEAVNRETGEKIETALPVVAAIELIHTYSLVHDDLPAMDDDDYRRGRPTSHKRFGEAAAILAGDALLTAAFAMLSDRRLTAAIPAERLLSVIHELGRAAGSLGMVGGQFVDIESEGAVGSQTVSEETLRYVHAHKTGAMIRAAVRVGALLGGAVPEALSSLTIYGERLGLAFQVVDDILDLEGTESETGKRVGKDAAQQKLTYPIVMGLEASKQSAHRLMTESLEALTVFGPEADPLRAIARFIVERKS
ncbi:MAG: polyprenyl synthetase family protein [Nitrospirae bacterium]|nr:polyprenyl synthetase family protein [Nitrospirota bacterium]